MHYKLEWDTFYLGEFSFRELVKVACVRYLLRLFKSLNEGIASLFSQLRDLPFLTKPFGR